MKKIKLLPSVVILLGLFALISCSKTDKQPNNTCGVVNPIAELNWLNEAIQEIEDDKYAYYSTAKLKGSTVFFYDNCNPLINYASILVDCEGKRIGLKNTYLSDLTDVSILWKHNDSLCNL